MRAPTVLLLLLAACASDGPDAPDPDFGGERIDVKVFGDGFVECALGRVPFEAFVLRLRQRMRALPSEARAGLWVRIDVDPDGGPPVARTVSRLLDELTIMGVRQGEYR